VGTVDFDPSSGVDQITSFEEGNAFLSSYDSNGHYNWTRTWGGPSDTGARGIAVNDNGDLYVTGEFDGTADLNPGPGVDEYTTDISSTDAYLIKLTASGEW
jgi:hypothetical protein